MNQKIRDRELKKYYLCIVHGTLLRPAGRLEGYILKDEAKKQVTVSSRPRQGPRRPSHCTNPGRPEQALPGALPAHHRAHPQIRAQFAAAGHPLLGDGKYGSERQNKRYGRSYQALYSYRLEFCFTTDAGALAPLGQQFQVEQVDFVTEYFPRLFPCDPRRSAGISPHSGAPPVFLARPGFPVFRRGGISPRFSTKSIDILSVSGYSVSRYL